MNKKDKIPNEIKLARIAACSIIETAKITSNGIIISTSIKTIGAIIIALFYVMQMYFSQTHPTIEINTVKTNQSSTAKNIENKKVEKPCNLHGQ